MYKKRLFSKNVCTRKNTAGDGVQPPHILKKCAIYTLFTQQKVVRKVATLPMDGTVTPVGQDPLANMTFHVLFLDFKQKA